MLQIKAEEFEQEVLKAEGVVLADFAAIWCGPCKMMIPVLNEFQGAKVVKIDVEECPDIASKYYVSAVPTLIFFKDGEEKTRVTGVQTKERLQILMEGIQ